MTEYIKLISDKVGNVTGLNSEYIKLTLVSLEIVVIITIIKIIIKNIYARINVDDRKKFVYNKKMQVILNTINVLLILLVWSEQLQNIMTLISFVSAGITIALREIIFNLFAGMYIKFSKPFELEDRIEIDNIKGDVINTHALGFEILEIGERNSGEQSTGRIVHIPNSVVFTKPLKNYVKAFKYIWDEITVKIKLGSNIEETKGIIYKILEEDEILKTIPKKMEDAIDDVTVEYRIYFNKLEPIIYTRIKDDHIELYVRFLVHPKKARNVEDSINKKILEQYKGENIELFEKEGK